MSGPRLLEKDRRLLLETARRAVERELQIREGSPAPDAEPEPSDALRVPRAVFVTLRLVDRDRREERPALRGCIGTLEAEAPLARAVARYARHAAFHDPRFPPLRAEEWPRVRLSISVLTEPRRVASADEIEPGRHGVVLDHDDGKAVFLPQVAIEQGWDRPTLLEHLARKAGLGRDAWQAARLWVFEAESFGDDASEPAVGI